MDHIVIAAERHIADQAYAAEGACAEAAAAAGIAPERAELCDDGDCACPKCPWAQPANC